LNNIQLCGICVEKHSTENFPSLLGLKEVYKGESEATKSLCSIAPRRPWQPRATGMPQDTTQQFFAFYNQNPSQTTWNDSYALAGMVSTTRSKPILSTGLERI
jgi:hypothetical protein